MLPRIRTFVAFGMVSLSAGLMLAVALPEGGESEPLAVVGATHGRARLSPNWRRAPDQTPRYEVACTDPSCCLYELESAGLLVASGTAGLPYLMQ